MTIKLHKTRIVLATGALLVGGLLAPRAASAGGYIVSEVDSAMSGRGTAAAAIQNSPSAVYFNPANLTALDGLQTRAAFTLIFPAFSYEADDGSVTGTESVPVTPPAVSMSYKLGNLGFGDMAFGLGFYVPYGSTIVWPDGWAGRDQLQDISLRVYEISPVIALKPNETFSVGLGLRILPSDVSQSRAVLLGSEQEGTVTLGGTATEFGVSAGVTIWGFENLTLALTWRSPVIMRYTGSSDFDFPAPFDTEARDSNVRTRLKLPQVFRLGAAYEIIPNVFNLSADLEFQQWSAFRQLKVHFEDEDGNDWDIQKSERNAEDSITFHFGAEYILFDALALRAGYVYDERTLPEESMNPGPPDSDRHVLTLGASYTLKDLGPLAELSFHTHFSNAFFVTRESNTSEMTGTWKGGHPADTMAYIVGISIGANFDIGPAFTYVPEEEEAPAAVEGATAVEAPAGDTPPAEAAEAAPAAVESIEEAPAEAPATEPEAAAAEPDMPEPFPAEQPAEAQPEAEEVQ